MKKRTLAYIGIVGGLAVVSLGLFTWSQYNKAVLSEAKTGLAGATKEMENMLAEEEDCLTNPLATYNDRALWYNDVKNFYQGEVDSYSIKYTLTSVPAYVGTILTLVSFGLVLKDADKQKEKEDNKQ